MVKKIFIGSVFNVSMVKFQDILLFKVHSHAAAGGNGYVLAPGVDPGTHCLGGAASIMPIPEAMMTKAPTID